MQTDIICARVYRAKMCEGCTEEKLKLRQRRGSVEYTARCKHYKACLMASGMGYTRGMKNSENFQGAMQEILELEKKHAGEETQ